MRIVLLCATARGLTFLDRLASLAAGDELVVCSFREAAGEPPFLDAIRTRAARAGASFHEMRRVEEQPEIWAAGVDLLFAVSWRYMVPPEVFRAARRGAYVFHDSLLPKYRGFSPTVWAIINREAETGVTVFTMSDAVDAGDIVDQRRVPLGPDDKIGEVLTRVTATYVELLEANFQALRTGKVRLSPQDHSKASYVPKRLPGDNEIRWEESTARLYALVRAVSRPYPGAYSWLDGRRFVVWDAAPAEATPGAAAEPGTVLVAEKDGGVLVRTGDGALRLLEVQRDGARAETPGTLMTTGMTLGSRDTLPSP